jgi:hypothetical protein
VEVMVLSMIHSVVHARIHWVLIIRSNTLSRNRLPAISCESHKHTHAHICERKKASTSCQRERARRLTLYQPLPKSAALSAMPSEDTSPPQLPSYTMASSFRPCNHGRNASCSAHVAVSDTARASAAIPPLTPDEEDEDNNEDEDKDEDEEEDDEGGGEDDEERAISSAMSAICAKRAAWHCEKVCRARKRR